MIQVSLILNKRLNYLAYMKNVQGTEPVPEVIVDKLPINEFKAEMVEQVPPQVEIPKNPKGILKNNIKSVRQRAKEIGIPTPKDAQEKIDIYTGKRISNE